MDRLIDRQLNSLINRQWDNQSVIVSINLKEKWKKTLQSMPYYYAILNFEENELALKMAANKNWKHFKNK